MFPKITIEQFRSNFITAQVEIGGLIARRRGPDSMDKPLRFATLEEAFRGVWEAVRELRNEDVPTLVLGPETKAKAAERAAGAAAYATDVYPTLSEVPAATDPAEIEAVAASGRPTETPDGVPLRIALDTAPPAPKRRGRPPKAKDVAAS